MATSKESTSVKIERDIDKTVILLFCLLVFLVLVLIFLYKKLNKDTDGQYTVRRMVYGEGGARDRVRGAAMALQSCLGIRLWPRNDEEENGGEMQEIHGGGRDVERGSRGGESEAGEEDNGDGREGEDDDSSDDYSSLDGCDLRELAKLRGQREEMGRAEGGSAELEEEEENKESEGGASGGTGLLIDLKQFSGSAIWSEEKTTDNKDSDQTAL